MKAFHSDPAIKAKDLARVRNHRLADEIIHGKYWENGKGCAVGCTVHSSDHGAYETELGIPRILARLEDCIFESLPNDLSKAWPERFLKAIKPGADISNVWPQFAVWMLTDDEWGVIKFARTDAQRESIQTISDMYLFKLEGAEIDADDWREAGTAASAAAAAAYASYVYTAAYAAATPTVDERAKFFATWFFFTTHPAA